MEQILKILQEAQLRNNEYTSKVSAEMLETTNVIGAGMSSLNTTLGAYTPIQQTNTSNILDLFPKVFVQSNSVALVAEQGDDGAVAVVAEGAEKPLVDGDFDVSQLELTKYAEIITISDEMLGDIDFMADAINRKLMRLLKNKIALDFIAYLGSNAGMVSGDLTGGTTGAKLMDCFPAIYADMAIQNGYYANLGGLDEPYFAKSYVEDSGSFNWVDKSDFSLLPMRVGSNIIAVATSQVPLYVLNDMTIEIGKRGDDFVKNMTSIRCEARVGFTLTAENAKAVYYDTIANTLGAIA